MQQPPGAQTLEVPVPASGTQRRGPRYRRPWRVTYAGGRVHATFRYRDNALERALDLVAAGRVISAWVGKRGDENPTEVRKNRKRRPTKVDEQP